MAEVLGRIKLIWMAHAARLYHVLSSYAGLIYGFELIRDFDELILLYHGNKVHWLWFGKLGILDFAL